MHVYLDVIRCPGLYPSDVVTDILTKNKFEGERFYLILQVKSHIVSQNSGSRNP